MKKFTKELGDSIISYINKLRIYSSLDELNNTDNSIVLISISSGFNSLEYYSEIFKNIIGVSPSKYRKLFLSRYRKTEYDKIQDNVMTINDAVVGFKEAADIKEWYKSEREELERKMALLNAKEEEAIQALNKFV